MSDVENWDAEHHHQELTFLLVLMCNLLDQDKLGERVLNRLVIGNSGMASASPGVVESGQSPLSAEDTSMELSRLLLDCSQCPLYSTIPKRGSLYEEGRASDTMRNAR